MEINGYQQDELVRLARAAEARDRARDRGGAVFAAFAVSVVAGALWANGAELWIVFAILAALAWAGVVFAERKPHG